MTSSVVSNRPRCFFRGDYTNRLPWIVRLLKDGELGTNNDSEDNKLMLIFTIESKKYKVIIYKNGYIFNNKFYSKPNILDKIKSMLLAG